VVKLLVLEQLFKLIAKLELLELWRAPFILFFLLLLFCLVLGFVQDTKLIVVHFELLVV